MDQALPVHALRGDYQRVLEMEARVFVNFRVGQARPAVTHLRGWVPEQYLLLDAPGTSDAPIEFRPGALWLLKYVAQGRVCVAHTVFLERTSQRIGGVYVTYPAEVHVHPLRQHQRVAVRMPIRFSVGRATAPYEPETFAEGWLEDISPGGCSIVVDALLAEDTALTLALSSLPGDPPIVLGGRVRHCAAAAKGYIAGIRFEGLTAVAADYVRDLVGADADKPDPLVDS